MAVRREFELEGRMGRLRLEKNSERRVGRLGKWERAKEERQGGEDKDVEGGVGGWEKESDWEVERREGDGSRQRFGRSREELQ
jgi:hypothetical protein